jgi:hypothetical protein
MAKRKASAAELLDRARAANERASIRLDHKDDQSALEIATAPLSWWRERWGDPTIRQLFIENFIFVRDAFDENKRVLLKFNDLQRDLHYRLTGRDVIVKGRRGGLSTLILARNFADAVVLSGRRVRTVPHDTDTEEEFRLTLKAMYEGLPARLQPLTRRYNEQRVLFNDRAKGTVDSELKTQTVQPGRENKGRGLGITNLHGTEVPYWKGKQRKAAIALIEAAAGGEVVLEFTAGGVEYGHSVYQQAKAKRNGWTAHFYQWWWKREYRIEGARFHRLKRNDRDSWVLLKPGESVRQVKLEQAQVTRRERVVAYLILRHLRKLDYVAGPVRWHLPEVAEYIAWRRGKIRDIGEKSFLIDYPESDRECFEQTGRSVIPLQYLKVTCSPSEPVPGHEYLVSVDTSAGLESGNPAAIQVIDIWTGRQAFEEKLRRSPDLLGDRVAEVSDWFNGARIVVERNNTGYATIARLKELGYADRLYKHLDAKQRRAVDDGRKSIEEVMEEAQYGFPTDKVNKPLAGLALEEAVRSGDLGLSSQEFCTQAMTVCWNDSGSFAALSGHEDDLFMALAIGWYVLRMQMGNWTGFVGVLPEVGDAR